MFRLNESEAGGVKPFAVLCFDEVDALRSFFDANSHLLINLS